MNNRTLSRQQSTQSIEKSPMTNVGPNTINRTLPIRLPNSSYRVREYLTDKEVERLIDAAKKANERSFSQLRADSPVEPQAEQRPVERTIHGVQTASCDRIAGT